MIHITLPDGAVKEFAEPVSGADLAASIASSLRKKAAGLRAEVDLRNETIAYKVREHSLSKLPAILAIGEQEAAHGTVSIRRLGEKGSRSQPLGEALLLLSAEAQTPLEDENAPKPATVPVAEPA